MKYDVVIVGAGPAGSTAAKVLSEKGVKTLLIDKDNFPRDKPCGGGLPYRVIKRFLYVESEGLIESFSYGGCAYYQVSKYELKYIGDEPLIGMVLRKKFDHGLVKLAVNAGCELRQGSRVVDVKITNKTAKVLLENGESIDSEIIVGADGVNSVIAKKTGLRSRDFQKGVCILQEFKVDEKTVEQYFTEKRLCYLHSRFKDLSGYGWVFPKKEHINIGIGEMMRSSGDSGKKINLLTIYREYIKALKQQKIIPNNLKLGRSIGGALPVYPLDKTYSNRVVLIGDAAGIISCTTGEGIYYAMSSGENAANILAELLPNEKTDEISLSKYEEEWKNDFGKELAILKKMVERESPHSIEIMFKKAHNDEKLMKLLVEVMLGKSSVVECKNKLIKRYIYSSIKDIFTSKK